MKYVISLVLVLVCFACKKDDSTQAPKCKLSGMIIPPGSNGQSGVISFFYDSIGRLSNANADGRQITYKYLANGFATIEPGNSAGWLTRSFTTVGADGKASTRRDTVYNGQSISSTTSTTYEYNNQGLLERIIRTGAHAAPSTFFTWQNGNIVAVVSGTTTYGAIDYYTDKPNQQAFNTIELSLFIELGPYAPQSKKLMKSITSGGQQVNFEYLFDNYGKVTETRIIGGGAAAIVKHNYTCD
jgi:hypothetical protein